MIKFIKYLFLSKHRSKRVAKLKSESSHESFEYMNKVIDNKRFETMDEYLNFLIEEGFIDKNHKPLKCKQCGSKKFFRYVGKWTSQDNPNGELMEDIRCNECGKCEATFYFNRWLTS